MGRRAPTHIKETQALQAPSRKETGSLAEERSQVSVFKIKRLRGEQWRCWPSRSNSTLVDHATEMLGEEEEKGKAFQVLRVFFFLSKKEKEKGTI